MVTTDATAPNSTQYTDDYLVLICSQAGTIHSVIEADEETRAELASSVETPSIDDLWPEAVTAQVRDSLKRVVRSRQTHCREIENDADGTANEFIFVVQGPDRVMVVVRDLSEQRRALSRARRLAYTDDATALPNREFLFNELRKITDVQRLREGRAALICLHVGQFDDHGYALNSSQQDEVLRQLATRLKIHLRGSNDDSADDYERYSVAARTDYRQFSIVLPSIESGADAEAVVARVVEDLKLPTTVGTRTVSVDACGGVALYPQDGIDPAALFENASGAMEDARNDPSAAYKFHSGTVRLRTLQRHDLEEELRGTLERNEYALNFLPIIGAESGLPTTVEALLRWPDTLLGTQPTRKIVRVAERTGLILPIGQWVLKHACEQLRVWHTAGYTDLRIAINISSQELVSDGIAERIEQVLDETNTDPRDLDIELREHMLFREVLTDYAACRKLKALGIRIVVDDYGVGACSLAQLSQSPVDAIKIDNSIVSNLESNDRDKAACAAAIAVAEKLGLDAVAEGVETEAQAQFLREHGCHYLQGFLFSTPMSDGEVQGYLKETFQARGRVGSLR
ncbi:MAG: putative bifunctional diguanylate cyclase/phosphodiesterase [Woeseiaceae bacterium]